MHLSIHSQLALGVVSCLTVLTGCVPLVVAMPPPGPLPSALMSADKGDTTVNAGVGSWSSFGWETALLVGPAAKPVQAQVEYGLTQKLQVGVATSAALLPGLYPGVNAGYTLFETEKSKMGLTLSVNGATIDLTSTSSTPAVDENGDPVLDENGEQVYDEESLSYGYFSVASGLGVRGERELRSKLDLVYSGSLAYAATFARYGVTPDDMRQVPWADASVGVVVSPKESLQIGANLRCLSEMSSNFLPMPGLGLSVGYTFPAN